MNVAHFPLIREVNKRHGPVKTIMPNNSKIPGNLRLTTALVAGIRQHRKYSDMVVWGERSKATKTTPNGKKYFVKSDNQAQKFDVGSPTAPASDPFGGLSGACRAGSDETNLSACAGI